MYESQDKTANLFVGQEKVASLKPICIREPILKWYIEGRKID